MGSYEKDIDSKIHNKQELPKKLDISILKYFWQSSLLSSERKSAIPYFLRNVESLKNFSDNELRVLSKYLHLRSFTENEAVFEQGDRGVGFYYIMAGEIELDASEIDLTSEYVEVTDGDKKRHIATLEKYDHFGELALLQENSIRTASARTKSETLLVGIFKPDMEEMIVEAPVVAGKLLQSISVILANRLANVTLELSLLIKRNRELEKNHEKN